MEALRQAALASVKSRAKTELLQQESSPSSIKADDDEDLSALREAALRSTKAHTTVILKDKVVAKCDTYSNPPLPHHHRNRRHQRHPRHSHQRHPYDTTQRNGNWRKYHYSQNRANNLIVIPLALQGENTKGAGYKLHKEQEPGSNLKLPENKSLLLSQDKLTGVQRSASETISSTADRNPKKRKDGKFSRYDDSESEEDSASDSDLLSLSSESHPKDTCSESENTVANQLDTRIVKHDESKDIVIQKAVSDNSEFEATGDSLEIQDKISSDSLLEDFDEPLLDIQENGELGDTTNVVMNTSDKQVTDDAFSVDLLPSESLDMESESADKEVLEARKKKFESTEEIKGSDLKKTISLKGIVPKSRKRHRQQHHHRNQREDKLSHSSHKEELHSQDLKERNCDELEDLHIKTSQSKNYQRQHNKYSSGSSRSSDDSCHSGSFSDSASQPIRLKDHPYYNVETGMSISNRFSQPMSSYGENQRRVVHERSPHRSSSKHARYDLSDLSDSGEDNENSLFKKQSLSSVVRTSPNPKRQKSRKVLDSDRHGNCPKEPCSSDSKAKHSSQPRGWTALMESRSKNWLTSDKDYDYRSNCNNMDLDGQLAKSSQINFIFENDEIQPAKKVDDRLSVHQRLGFTSKTKLEISEKSTGKQQEKNRENRKNKSSDPSKETELDQKILRIQEMNAAILKRQAEVKKDKERYG